MTLEQVIIYDGETCGGPVPCGNRPSLKICNYIVIPLDFPSVCFITCRAMLTLRG